MNEPKRALRSELVAVRGRLSTGDRAARAIAIADRITEVPGFSRARIVAAYAALGAEVDPAEIAVRACARGVSVVYPRATRNSRLLAFARSAPAELAPGPLRALEPPATSPDVPPGEIDAVLVPCVAVTSDGARLGRGGGYYDTTLPALPRAIRIGLAYEVQLVPTLPREAHDAPLDAVVTEARVLLFTRGPRPQGASPT
jgi:5-formyltetrahydrofolate cyclo-ligase